MFFCKADKHSSKTLLKILALYEKASGQKINTTKTSIVFSSKAPSDLRKICMDTLGIGHEGGLGKYLGLPQHFGRQKKDIFASILDRIRNKVQSWSTKFLSSAGKLVLLKSVLAAIPNYAMLSFKLPACLCRKIQSLLTRFWWDSNSGKRKMNWISWKKLSRPKPLGGLGFKDIQNFNDALLAKTSWRIIQNPDSLLSRLLLSKYCENSNFLEAKEPINCSHGWRGILIGRSVIMRRLCRTIGNGKTTNIWNTPWIPNIPLRGPTGPPLESYVDLKVHDLLRPQSGQWNEPLISSLFPHILTDILKIRSSELDGEDRWMWAGTRDGNYSTRSGYFAITEDEEPITPRVRNDTQLDWMKNVWHLNCTPKVRMFLWRIFNRAIPVGETLVSHGLQGQFPCPHCGQDESLYHTFFECHFAKGVWDLIQWKSPFSFVDISIDKAIALSVLQTALPPVGVGTGPLSPWILWSLWKTRNQLLFQQRKLTQVETLNKAIRDAREWLDAQPIKAKDLNPTAPRIINLLEDSTSLMFTSAFSDAAWDSTLLVSGSGFCFTDPITGRSQNHSIIQKQVSSPLIGEGLAILATLKKAIDLDLSWLRLFSDSKECIDSINSHSSHRELHGILCDIFTLIPRFQSISFHFISRSCTSHVDRLAKQALREFVLDNNFGSH